jgi:hypothetical protein
MTLDPGLAREAIRDLAARYNIAGDGRRLDDFVGVFTEDAVYDSAVFRCRGRAEIRNYLQAAWDSEPGRPMPRSRRHHITTAQIDLEGADDASGQIYYLMCTDLGPDHGGYYLDRYRRTAEGWRMASRQVWMDWSRPDSLFVPEASKRLVAAGQPCGPPPA